MTELLDARAAAAIAAWRVLPARGVLFDFNGTLSDDEPLLLEIFTTLAADPLRRPLAEADYFQRLAGRSDREILEVLVAESPLADRPGLVDELLPVRRDHYLRLVAERSPVTPTARALVRRMADDGVAVGIVTGAQRPDVQAVISGCGLDSVIGVVVTEEDVTAGKPDPQGYLMGAAALGLDPGAVLAFEDSVAGLHSARAAGCTALGLPGTRAEADLAPEADGIVRRLDPALLD